jgi:single-stranded DNA-binding protein
MASFDISGKLIEKYDVEQITDSFKKREFVLEIANPNNSEWNDFIKFQSVQDRVSLIDPFNVGDTIKVGFNIKGRKWEKEGKVNYFSNLEAWRIESASGAAPAAASAPPAAEKTSQDIVSKGDEDDLPF